MNANNIRKAPELSIVVPTFNEKENISILVEKIKDVMEDEDWEIIFVDDNSPDGTSSTVKELGRQDRRVRGIRRIGRRGLAGACIEGILSSQAEFVAVMDADLQHDESLLTLMLEQAREGSDLVVASRYIDGGSSSSFSPIRAKISEWSTWLAKKFLHITLSDPMSGFFMVRRTTVDGIVTNLSSQGYKILLDIVATKKGNLRISELPFVFRNRIHGESKLDSSVAIDFISLIINKLTRGLVSLRFILFSLVGLTGLGLHLLFLSTALSLNLQFEFAQALSTAVIVAWNYMLNNFLTYRDQRLRGIQFFTGLIRFELICSMGIIANVGVASFVYSSDSSWWLAGIAGAVMGVMWNYLISSVLVWRNR